MVTKECVSCGESIKYSCNAEAERRYKTGNCRKCYIKNVPSGNKANNYKRGYFIRSGYKFVLAPKHPKANNLGYIREHRLVVEKSIGRFLERTEIVHHRDGNKLNNEISNLEIVTQSEHCRDHMTKNRKCTLCMEKHLSRGFCKNHYWIMFLKNHRSHKI